MGVKNIKKSAAVRFQTQRSTQSVALHTIELGSGREKKVGGCAWLDGRFAMVAKYGAGRSIYIYKSKLKKGRDEREKTNHSLVLQYLHPGTSLSTSLSQSAGSFSDAVSVSCAAATGSGLATVSSDLAVRAGEGDGEGEGESIFPCCLYMTAPTTATRTQPSRNTGLFPPLLASDTFPEAGDSALFVFLPLFAMSLSMDSGLPGRE